MKSITWTGKNGNKIELRAECSIAMKNTEYDLDGDKVTGNPEPRPSANLELWVDGKKIDDCWDINFWRIIDYKDGIKKVWGLKLLMDPDQAVKVDEFLKSVIDNGKAEAVKAHEKAEAAKVKSEKIEAAKRVIAEAEHTRKLGDKLMTDAEAKTWRKRYNEINNEGGEGYIPEVITQEQYDWAKSILDDCEASHG